MYAVAAPQPIKGGRAPTTDPIQVLVMLIRFIGVYTQVYNRWLATPI